MKDKISWEETILHIRELDQYKDLVKYAYFEKDLVKNVESFRKSEEFLETLKIIKFYNPDAKTILDVGSGNGISAISFALEGYKVTVIEPDSSDTVGAGAINFLKQIYNLDSIEINNFYFENNPLNDTIFDIVYARQSMHHASNLNQFVKEGSRVLKQHGLFFTVRDHVIYDNFDKEKFLIDHPLHKFYGGENAYTSKEYRDAIFNANLKLIKEMKFYDNVINFYPLESEYINRVKFEMELRNDKISIKLLKVFSSIPIINYFSSKLVDKCCPKLLDETKISGRMYSYIAVKE